MGVDTKEMMQVVQDLRSEGARASPRSEVLQLTQAVESLRAQVDTKEMMQVVQDLRSEVGRASPRSDVHLSDLMQRQSISFSQVLKAIDDCKTGTDVTALWEAIDAIRYSFQAAATQPSWLPALLTKIDAALEKHEDLRVWCQRAVDYPRPEWFSARVASPFLSGLPQPGRFA